MVSGYDDDRARPSLDCRDQALVRTLATTGKLGSIALGITRVVGSIVVAVQHLLGAHRGTTPGLLSPSASSSARAR